MLAICLSKDKLVSKIVPRFLTEDEGSIEEVPTVR